MRFGLDLTKMRLGWAEISSGPIYCLTKYIVAANAYPEEIYQPVGTLLYCAISSCNKPGYTYTYQWRANGVNIGGATSFSYTILIGDIGKTIDCVVTTVQNGKTYITNSIIAMAVPNFFVDTTLTTADSTIITSDKY